MILVALCVSLPLAAATGFVRRVRRILPLWTTLTPIWSVLAKAAYYDGDSGQPDTTRFWLQTTLEF